MNKIRVFVILSLSLMFNLHVASQLIVRMESSILAIATAAVIASVTLIPSAAYAVQELRNN